VKPEASTSGLSFAPNISWLLPDLPFGERPAALAQIGFTALEFGFPSHADIPALEAARRELGLEIILFNQDVPVWDAGNRGYLVDERRHTEFQRTLDEALDIARRLGVHKIMLPSGVEVADQTRLVQREWMLANLRSAAPQAERAGVMLTIEVLNPVDNPGYFLTSIEEALAIVREVNHPLVRFQLDTYHVTLMGGDPLALVREQAPWIGHIQFADVPGRHEPGTGKIDFAALLAAAERAGYRGYIGLEYIPQAEGARALAWVPPDRR
jgi:hydroxypyruvate isomerase